MAVLGPLQLSCGPSQYHEALGQQFGTVQIEERVEAGQAFVHVPVQLLQIVGDLALYVRDAPLRLHVLLASTVVARSADGLLLAALTLPLFLAASWSGALYDPAPPLLRRGRQELSPPLHGGHRRGAGLPRFRAGRR